MAVVNRQHGQFAVATISGTTLLLKSWELRYETKTVDVTAHGDNFDQIIVTTTSWRFRATCLVTGLTTTTVLSDLWNNTQPSLATVNAYTGPVGAGNLVFTGQGYATSGSLTSPEGMMECDVEITGTGVPTAGV